MTTTTVETALNRARRMGRLYPHFLLGQFIGIARCSDIRSPEQTIAHLQELMADYDAYRALPAEEQCHDAQEDAHA